MKSLFRSLMLMGALSLGHAGHALAQAEFPAKPIRLVAVTSAGTATDHTARFLADRLSRELGVTVIVDNKPGANTIIATEFVTKSPPDGYTLLFQGAPHYVNKTLYRKLPFDPVNDVRMVARLAETPLVVVVPSNSRFTSLVQMTDFMRDNPDKVNYSSAGSGSTSHMATTLLLSMAGVRAAHVPYKNSDAALNDASAGHVDLMITGISNAAGLLAGGKLRALAVTGAQRTSALPDVPTIAELGFKGYRITSRLGVMAPVGVPDAVVDRLSTAILKAMKTPEFDEFCKKNGMDPDLADARTYQAELLSEFDYWAKVVEISGAKID